MTTRKKHFWQRLFVFAGAAISLFLVTDMSLGDEDPLHGLSSDMPHPRDTYDLIHVEGHDTGHEHLFRSLVPDHNLGITVEPVLFGEVFSNVRGGISTRDATKYLGMFDLAITTEFQETPLPIPGRFFIFAQNFHGKGLTEDYVGDFQVLSNIDAFREGTQVSEYWWEFGFFDDDLVFRLGKQDLNTEFAYIEMGGDFIGSSYGIPPTLLVPTFPDPMMAAVVMSQLTETLAFRAGIWDGAPDGTKWGFSGTGVTYSVAELDYRFDSPINGLPGRFLAGVGYGDSGVVSPGVNVDHGVSYYITAEQMLWRANCDGEHQDNGFGIFCSYAWTPEDHFDISDLLTMGYVRRGAISCRPNDTCGGGVSIAQMKGTPHNETAIELFYKAQITPWMMIQPDIQYIANPSGIYPDAVVIGMRYEIVL